MYEVCCGSNRRGNERIEDVVKFLRLRPDAKRSDIIRVYNDTVMKLEAVIVGLEKDKNALKEKVEELGSLIAAEEEV